MNRTVRRALALTLVAGGALGSSVSAQSDLQPIPPLTAHVNDLTGTLDPGQQATLEAELRALEQTKGSQVGILMVATTQPEDIAAYGIRVADAWKLGRQGTDDGVIVIIAKNDHRVRIEVGRGLEGAIPDAAASRVIREFIAPRFRADDYFGGLRDAVDALGKLIRDEPLPAPLTDEPGGGGDLVGGLGPALVAGWFVAMFLRGVFRRAPSPLRGAVVGMGSGGAAWLLSGLIPLGIAVGIVGAIIGLVGTGAGRFVNRGGWGGFSGGGFGGGFGGGGGGGGFSGGGGGFSGGGASGKW